MSTTSRWVRFDYTEQDQQFEAYVLRPHGKVKYELIEDGSRWLLRTSAGYEQHFETLEEGKAVGLTLKRLKGE